MSVAQWVATFALHAVWQIPLLALAACLALRTGRPSIRAAHTVWTATLFLCVMLPLLSTWHSYKEAGNAEWAVASQHTLTEDALDRNIPQHNSAWQRLLRNHLHRSSGFPLFSVALSQRTSLCLALAYLLVVTIALARFCLSIVGRQRLAKHAATQVPQSILDRWHARALQMRCSALAVQVHPGIAGPVLVGTFRLKLLLPQVLLERMREDEMDAVFAHELAHIRRRDPLLHALCSAILLPVQFHPVALWVARRIRQTREMACDAEAAQVIGSSTRYAGALLRVAEQTLLVGPASTVLGLGLFDTIRPHRMPAGAVSTQGLTTGMELFGEQGTLEERMVSILRQPQPCSLRARVVRSLVSALIAAVGLTAAWMVQVRPAVAEHREIKALTGSEPPSAAAHVAPRSGPQWHSSDSRQRTQQTKPTAAPLDAVQSLKLPANNVQGFVLSKVQPIYPEEAKQKKIQGEVVLHAFINRDGSVGKVVAVASPDPLLTASASDAVRQWKYKPYRSNGRPTAVETSISITYSFAN